MLRSVYQSKKEQVMQSNPGEAVGIVATETAMSERGLPVLAVESIRELTEIGFMAATTGRSDMAEIIFNGLLGLHPRGASAELGLAITWMFAQRPMEAAALLERTTATSPAEYAVITAWHGLALQLAGRNGQARKLLEKAATSESAGGAFACQLLNGKFAGNGMSLANTDAPCVTIETHSLSIITKLNES